MERIEVIKRILKFSKQIGRPVYHRLPHPVQVATTFTYRGLRRALLRPVEIPSRQGLGSIPCMDSTESTTPHQSDQPAKLAKYDIQNLKSFLGLPNQFIESLSENKWITLDKSITINISYHNAYELQFAFVVKTDEINVKSSKIQITPTFDGIDGDSQECELSHSDGFITFRIHPPVNSGHISVRIEDPNSSAVVCNEYSMASVLKGISVVVGVYKEERLIQNLLESLSQQNSPRDRFEIIFVVNGPKDGSEKIIRNWMIHNPDIQSSIHYDPKPSLSNARNVGTKHSRYSHITFIDADDTISTSYLSSMYERLHHNAIMCSNIINIFENGSTDINNNSNSSLLSITEKSSFPPQDAPNFATMSACKAIPSFMVRSVPFLVHLKNGEDTPFYCEIYARFPHIFLNLDDDKDRCTYYRLMRSDSLSRRELSYEFHVLDRLRVIKEIARVASLPQLEDIRRFNYAKMSGQIGFISEYIRAHPKDYLRILHEIESFNIQNFPLDRLKDYSSTQLVIAYCFPPFQDASAIVMAKRIYEAGVPCDVISNEMKSVREEDIRLLRPIKPFLARHLVLDCPVSFASWPGIQSFADAAVKHAEQIQAFRERAYERMYSRAQWVSSHFAALQIKLRQPDIFWTAEFSDPLLYGVNGDLRLGDIDSEWLQSSGLLDRLSQLGVDYDSEQKNLFYWCELATIHLADELIFTNKNQLQYMRGYLPTEQDRVTVDTKAIVSPHPIAKGWLSNLDRANEPQISNLNLAYFGSFYINRGVGELLSALRNLPVQERTKIRIYIYSREYKDAKLEAEYLGISDIVICKPEMPYADMISELNKFDLLVVNDAKVDKGKINPFLPSKISDYKQSDVPILAIYQPGSAMSKLKDIQYKVSISLPDHKFESAIRTTLRKAADDKRCRLHR
ncbi:glycosyltransferase [Brucella intermedia]|uniref:glycosyltransferase n=1 Tax=Brucella intermedia TaxID=94625 RepID=UPI00124C2FC5|nr:glycosyltransferase [Brucella intermedia]KAB2709733.1 glycosyltransferase [Brucella intermedia]